MPKAKEATRLETTVRLQGMKWTPEKVGKDGGRRAESVLVLDAIHQGEDAEAFFRFLAQARGKLRIGLVPADEDLDELEWSGDGHLGGLATDLPATRVRDEERGSTDYPTTRFPIRIQAVSAGDGREPLEPLETLFQFRLALSRLEENEVRLTAQPLEESLDYEGGEE